MIDSAPSKYSNSSVSDHVIRSGETLNWFELPANILPPDIQTRIARVAIEVCYASVYDEHWIVEDGHAGQGSCGGTSTVVQPPAEASFDRCDSAGRHTGAKFTAAHPLH